MLNLATHCEGEKDDKVHQEDRPKDGDIEEGEERAEEANADRSDRIIPEFEFWESSHEGTEFVD